MQLTLHTGDDEDDNSCEKSSLKSLRLKLMEGMGIFYLKKYFVPKLHDKDKFIAPNLSKDTTNQ